MAKNVLSARLRKLVDNGILEMRPAADGTAYQEYVLTEKGNALFPIVVALRQWGESYLCEPGELDNFLVDRASLQPVRRLELKSSDGRLLRAGDMQVISAKQLRMQRAGVAKQEK